MHLFYEAPKRYNTLKMVFLGLQIISSVSFKY